jgi:hypothetical protein
MVDVPEGALISAHEPVSTKDAQSILLAPKVGIAHRTYAAFLQVSYSIVGVVQHLAGNINRHAVEGEITPTEVLT